MNNEEIAAAATAAAAGGNASTKSALMDVMLDFNDVKPVFDRAKDPDNTNTRIFNAQIRRIEVIQHGSGEKLRIVLNNPAREGSRQSDDGFEIIEPEFFLGETTADDIQARVVGKEGHWATIVKDIKEHPSRPDRKISYLYWIRVSDSKSELVDVSANGTETTTPDGGPAKAWKPVDKILKALEDNDISKEDLKTRWTEEHPDQETIDPGKDFEKAIALIERMYEERQGF